MTTSLDSTPQPADTTPQTGDPLPAPSVAQTPHRETAQPRRKHSAGHVIAIVVGCFMLLPGFGMALGGGALAVGQAVATDDDGYFRFTLDPLLSDGFAITTDDVWLDVEGEDWPWVLDWIDLGVRLRVDGTATTDEVFVGIARSADVERFLSGTSYSSVTELIDRTPQYEQIRGERRNVALPGDQDFWVASSSGAGEQEVTWDARGGHWAIVVMNADSTPDVSADVEIGARSGAVTPIAVTLLIAGSVILLAGIALIVVGARGRRDHRDEQANPFIIEDRPSPLT